MEYDADFTEEKVEETGLKDGLEKSGDGELGERQFTIAREV